MRALSAPRTGGPGPQSPASAGGPNSSTTGTQAVDTSSTAESIVVQLKESMALDAQRETLASGVSASAHRVGMTIIGNMKA